MFAQSVDENVGGRVTNYISAPGEWGKVMLIFFAVLVGCLAIFSIIMYFVRKKLPKEDRKPKIIKLP